MLASSGLTDATITVLDDRSEPETTDFVAAWCEANGAHYVRNDTPMGTGPLRNLVIRESAAHFGKGDFLGQKLSVACFF